MISRTFCMCLINIYLSTRLTLQASVPSSNHYIGAVVEYYPITKSNNITAAINENTKNYMTFIKTASENEADIIVFPENGLFAKNSGNRTEYIQHSTYLPHPKDAKVPCHDPASNVMEAIKAISCAANRHALYIVINVREKEKCVGQNCSKDGFNIYNTNVVFDRKGTVIAKYRKWNLFGELGINMTSKPELSTFKTDFDVIFGQFICFDVLFETPALKLLTEKKATDIVFSSHWFSELPFMTANQVQSGWSYINNVNFLGSGFNAPGTGSGGSGIYAGKEGHFARVWTEKPANALIVAEIPKIVNGRRMQPINPNDAMVFFYSSTEITTIANIDETEAQQKMKIDDLTPYTTQLFSPKNGIFNVTLCDRGLCCNFTTNTQHREDVVKDNVKYYRYRLAVFSGQRTYSNIRTAGVEICSIISCTDEDLNSCGQRFDYNTIIVHPTIFNSIEITSTVKEMQHNQHIQHMPFSINTELHPLNVSDFTFTSTKINGTHVNLKYSLIKPRKDLMTFAIYGRNFTADGLPKTNSSAAMHLAPIALTMIMLLIVGMTNAYGVSLFSSGV